MRAELVAFCVAFACVGCAHTLDRTNVGGTVETNVPVEDVPVHGATVVVDLPDAPSIEGELLAVEDIYVHVLDEEGQRVSIRRTGIDKVSVDVRKGSAGWYALWAGIGTISTLSHGFLLIGSAPIWLVVGTATTTGEGVASADVAVREAEDYALLRHFARYPQGMPRMRAEPAGELSVPEPYRWSETDTDTDTDAATPP